MVIAAQIARKVASWNPKILLSNFLAHACALHACDYDTFVLANPDSLFCSDFASNFRHISRIPVNRRLRDVRATEHASTLTKIENSLFNSARNTDLDHGTIPPIPAENAELNISASMGPTELILVPI